MDRQVTDKKTLDDYLINDPSYVSSFYLKVPNDFHGHFSFYDLYHKLFAKNNCCFVL